jgi:phospholipid/cholesterol/gamma-HCH transport system substrate-binding protein
MSNKRAIELAVGVFVALGLGAVALLAFRVSNLTTTEVTNPYQVQARFENIGGLKTRAPVTMAGVRIGRVHGISFDSERYQALVTLDIDGRYERIPIDTSASILTSGLLGEQYVGMEPGGAEEYLRDGDSIQLTQSAMVLERLISQFLYGKASETNGSGSESAAPPK